MSIDIHAKLRELGYELPQAASPAANYIPYTIVGNIVYISGQIPFINGEQKYIGQLGGSSTIEHGQEAAQACALNILAQLDQAIGQDWSRLVKCIKLGGFVNSTNDFRDHPKVINGASNLIAEVLDEKGKHTRFAVGASGLPFGVAVEVEAMFEITV